MVKIEYLTPASPEERKRYYREEWNIKQVPEYIIHSIQ
jgi:DNA primase small subunit